MTIEDIQRILIIGSCGYLGGRSRSLAPNLAVDLTTRRPCSALVATLVVCRWVEDR